MLDAIERDHRHTIRQAHERIGHGIRSQDGKQLYVIVKFEGGRGRVLEFRRVYDGATVD